MANQSPSTDSSKTTITTPAIVAAPTVGNPNTNSTNVITFNVAVQFPVKLTTDNYSSWSRQFISLLKVYRLYEFLLGMRPCPPIDPTPNSPYDVWVRQDQSIQHAILTSIAQSTVISLIRTVVLIDTKHVLWLKDFTNDLGPITLIPLACTEKLVESIISLMGATFSIKDLGCLNYFLGVNVIFTNVGLFLSQAQYIRELLAKFGMSDAKPVQSPLSIVLLQLHQGNQLFDAQPYRQLVGSLQYLALTWPDISFAVNKLSQFLHATSDVHWQATKRILRYLKGSLFHGLLLCQQPISPLHAFSDSDWAGDKDTYHSTTGYVVFLGSNPISWRACKQRTIARSSTEAEYCALTVASSELVWLKHLLHELGHPISECPTIYCDNVGATHLILSDDAATKHWGKLLHTIVTLSSRPEQERVEQESKLLDVAENVRYTVAFVKLYNVGKKEEDPLFTDIKDPKQFLVASLARLSSLSSGRYAQIISEHLEPMNQAALLQHYRTYSCFIV
ncbi:hypothetical protein SLEP1_g2250 [Rubroshorea leprosula]|uniref:Uncharacterized protein n=1 Tax=Rubroshorea leprosula TaxID=152421 RepID=A0AAV5HGJ4_9ROSI|nr:hypothetical protein SLEP1_g2250 [Rubroshorea leprosula]